MSLICLFFTEVLSTQLTSKYLPSDRECAILPSQKPVQMRLVGASPSACVRMNQEFPSLHVVLLSARPLALTMILAGQGAATSPGHFRQCGADQGLISGIPKAFFLPGVYADKIQHSVTLK